MACDLAGLLRVVDFESVQETRFSTLGQPNQAINVSMPRRGLHPGSIEDSGIIRVHVQALFVEVKYERGKVGSVA